MGGSAGPLQSDHLFYMCQNHLFYMTCQNLSLIDNIFTNEQLNQSISGLFLNDISDHLPIFAVISGYEQIFHRNKNYFTFCSRNQQNLIKSEIENVNWAELPGYNDPSLAYGNFLKKYTAIYNRCFPLKKVKAKGYTLYKPWLTKALLKSIKKKNVLYKCFLNNPTAQTEFLYKTSAKKIRLIISLRVAKRLYYGNNIGEAKSNVKMSLRLLNEILNKKSSKQNLPIIVFKSGNQKLSDPAQIVEQFCRYFTNIGP